MANLKDIKGYEHLYAVTRDGRVWSYAKTEGTGTHHPGKWRKFSNSKGYSRTSICKNGSKVALFVHRLVAQTHIPNPLNLAQVNHINGIKDDNRVENLEWCTPSQNQKHSFKMGFASQRGEKNSCAKLTEKVVREIRERRDSGERVFDIARGLKVHVATINDVLSGRTWAHVK